MLTLERFSYTPKYTEGWLLDDQGGRLAYTIERPWRDNLPNISCIPEGRYDLYRHTRPNGHHVFRLIGGTVVGDSDRLHPADGKTRWGILIHSGNTAADVSGCIAPGLDRDAGKVLNSRDAMEFLRTTLYPTIDSQPDGFIRLRVRQYRPFGEYYPNPNPEL